MARGAWEARDDDVRAAREWGATIVTSRYVHEHGIASALDKVPRNARAFVTFDCDALEPSIMPGVAAPVPGGLTYWQVIALFENLGRRARIVGFDLVELAPHRDVNALSALTAVRIVTLGVGAIGRSGTNAGV